MIDYDYLIVGSGLTGAVFARQLADAGKKILVIEKRDCLGGNIADHVHPSGIRVHTYGPHYFRTNDEKLWQFVKKFSEFYEYVPHIQTLVDDELVNWPVCESYIRNKLGERWNPDFVGDPMNFEEASLKMMPSFIYNKFVKGYTEKQWGVPASELSVTLAKRFDVRTDNDTRLMKHKYQGLPKYGYSKFISNMLKDIPVLVNCDFHDFDVGSNKKSVVIYTGPIDEYFNFSLGKLKYRGQLRVSEYYPELDYYQSCGQINNPSLERGSHIRTLEWKHMMDRQYGDRIVGTVITKETPYSPIDSSNYEYPFPDEVNQKLYKEYREMADCLSGVIICGRLGEYRYYDMDQCIARALMLSKKVFN